MTPTILQMLVNRLTSLSTPPLRWTSANLLLFDFRLGVPIQDSYAFDGAAIPYTSSALASASSLELLQVESWTGTGSIEGLPAGQYFNNTYKALRMITDGNSFFYSK
jgi:hypothetical protein